MKVLGCEMVPFTIEERDALDGCEIVGRARLALDGGGVVHALVLFCPVDGRHRAVYLNRHTGTFETFAVEAERD